MSGVALGDTDCPTDSRFTEFTDKLNLPGESNSKLKNEVMGIYQRFYCKDRRTFQNQLALKLSGLEQVADEGTRQILEKWRKEFGLPSGKDSDQLFLSDKARIQEFNRLFQNYRKELFPKPNDDALRNLDVVLVGGLGSDYQRGQTFTDISEVLKDNFHLPKDRVHYLFPDSFAGQQDGIKQLKDEIDSIRRTDPNRKILLIGYSRGGLVSLEGLAEHPELLDSLFAVVTVNAPLKGTLVAKVGQKVLDKLSRAFAKLGEIGASMNFCNCHEGITADWAAGMRAIEPNESLIKKLGKLSDENYLKLSKILFFVTTSVLASEEPTKVGTYVLEGEHDGTVPKSSQFLRSIGRRMADLHVGHTDLFMSGIKSSLNKYDRQAFARALIDTVTNPNFSYDP